MKEGELADTNEAQQARANLAFMKALVEEGGRVQTTGGAAFLAAGLLFGAQALVQWAHIAGLIHLSGQAMTTLIVLVPVVFVAVLATLIRRQRTSLEGGPATRALKAAFGGLGLGNVVLCAVFGLLSWSRGEPEVWFLYGVAICVMLGAAWYVAAMVRRRAWLWVVAAGWYVTALGLGVVSTEERLATYFLLLGVALVVLLALPGAAMMRSGRKAA
jgi:hypothetical protein